MIPVSVGNGGGVAEQRRAMGGEASGTHRRGGKPPTIGGTPRDAGRGLNGSGRGVEAVAGFVDGGGGAAGGGPRLRRVHLRPVGNLTEPIQRLGDKRRIAEVDGASAVGELEPHGPGGGRFVVAKVAASRDAIPQGVPL
ncbi:hypothetical protein CMI37_04655 [Candidatus Pacearchaeota archaeon]|nr:hypothetical protein [Candidatus Pacearchaeota archaeon]